MKKTCVMVALCKWDLIGSTNQISNNSFFQMHLLAAYGKSFVWSAFVVLKNKNSRSFCLLL